MNNQEENEYMKSYQTLLFENVDGQHANNNVKRNCLVHTFLSSVNKLDNDTTCKILQKDLDDYMKINNEKLKMLEQKIKNSMTNNKYLPKKLHSTLNNIDANSIMNNPPCFVKGTCKNSEAIDDAEFDQFMKSVFKRKKDATNSLFTKENNLHSKNIAEPKSNNTTLIHNSKPEEGDCEIDNKYPGFRTAAEEMYIQNLKKHGNTANTTKKRSLGMRKTVSSKFVSPLLSKNNSSEEFSKSQENEDVDPRLKNIEPKMVELILSEIMELGPSLTWDDIAGLEFAKTAIQEAVVWPMLRPDIFTGLRRPPKGILLFGPPGTGKTLIGKCVASQSKSTFFSISASSLTSKWIGDGEKMVRALFTVARCHQPAVIFIDEIDSLLSQRSETEHECSRRIKTEFLVQLDGATTDNEERLLVIGATNRPQELDEAARRRFVKRLYIPLPETNARYQLVQRLMSDEKHSLTNENVNEVANLTDGYSGADMKNLCSEASMGPIRSLDITMIQNIQATEVRHILMDDFVKALTRVKSSVSNNDLNQYVQWDKLFGCGSGL